jgi:UDP-2,3-diacylglucosamine pyrophosphatase LpxH
MTLSRARFLRGLGAASLLLPTAALAKTETTAFTPDQAPTGALPWTAKPGTSLSPLRFVVVGDRTGLARPGVFEQALQQVKLLQPDFILSVGELIEGYHEDRAEIDRQWSEVETAIAATGIPFIHTPGNHDIDNGPTSEAWEKRRGPRHYSFTYKGALFIVLNTEDTPQPMPEKLARQFNGLVAAMKADPVKTQKAISDRLASGSSNASEYVADMLAFGDKQIAFVRDTLKKHPHVQWTFVVMHKPAWKKEFNCFADIQTLLQGRPHTVMAGHTHYFTHEVIDGSDYINMGTTGGIFSTGSEDGKPLRLGPGTMDHVLLVNLQPQGPVIANLRLSGLMDSAGQTGQTLLY